MSLLSVASSGAGQMKAITLWGAASAAGAAIGPLVGGVLVESTGWQGLFWIDAAIAAACVPLTRAAVKESRDPNRPRSIDFAGTILVALMLAPIVLALAVGLGIANGPASADEVGAASGISNMARYVGAAVAVAAVAMVNNAVINNHREAGESAADALAAGLASSALMMAIWSAAGIALIALMARQRRTHTRAIDRAAAAAASLHTIPTESRGTQ
jgi:MFS family permease